MSHRNNFFLQYMGLDSVLRKWHDILWIAYDQRIDMSRFFQSVIYVYAPILIKIKVGREDGWKCHDKDMEDDKTFPQV